MRIPKNGFNNVCNIFTWNGRWYGIIKKYGKNRYLRSYSVRFDNTRGGTEDEMFYLVFKNIDGGAQDE